MGVQEIEDTAIHRVDELIGSEVFNHCGAASVTLSDAEDCYINGHQDAVDDILKWLSEAIPGQYRSISACDSVRLVRDLKEKFKVDLE